MSMIEILCPLLRLFNLENWLTLVVMVWVNGEILDFVRILLQLGFLGGRYTLVTHFLGVNFTPFLTDFWAHTCGLTP